LSTSTAILVGDVGGTHARFAIVDAHEPGSWHTQQRLDLEAEYEGFEAALRDYIERSGISCIPAAAAIAVAGPVTAGAVQFTNRRWHISESKLRDFGFAETLLINDFAALACAVAELGASELRNIGPELTGLKDASISVIGPGTGFGVSCLARARGWAVPMATEGGHIGFAPSDEQEMAVLRLLWGQGGRVSIERLLSGRGLETLYLALQRLSGHEGPALSAAHVTANALAGDAACRAALTMFCSIFGAAAGDIALAHGALGGVYLAGGIAQKIEPFLLTSPFRARFESKGRLSAYVQQIPTKLILSQDAAMLGAAGALRHARAAKH
jgi:glucokinase